MIIGTVVSLILDYAAVAIVIGLFALVRWSGIGLGRTLDLLLLVVLVAAVTLSLVAWLAGSRFDLRLTHDISGHAEAGSLSTECRQAKNIPDD
jgi:hypothetical protein